MFLMIGINDDQRELEYSRMVVCDACGAYGRYQLFMQFTVLSLFLIPLLKWNKRYYVRMRCCGAMYELDREIGGRIARGDDVEILPEHLTPLNRHRSAGKQCFHCGYATGEDFDFCPKCGHKF